MLLTNIGQNSGVLAQFDDAGIDPTVAQQVLSILRLHAAPLPPKFDTDAATNDATDTKTDGGANKDKEDTPKDENAEAIEAPCQYDLPQPQGTESDSPASSPSMVTNSPTAQGRGSSVLSISSRIKQRRASPPRQLRIPGTARLR